ncbi:MAG TPA: terminase gpA endonuclease subunit [Gemmatimonadales bacterium]
MTLAIAGEVIDEDELARWDKLEREERRGAFAAISPLDVAAWAREHLMMSPEENDGQLAPYDPDLTPWHAPIMRAMGDLRVHRVVGVLPAQVGGKTTIMKADLGARIHLRPSPILWGVPRDSKDVRTWSKDRVDPMFRDIPVLRGLVSDETRDKMNTIARKAYPGGYLGIVGMTQSADLQARPVAVIRVDELDQVPRDAGRQGTPLRQLATRMKRFHYRHLAAFGTPTNEDDSPIMEEFATTNRSRLHLPCPLCGELQILKFGSRDVAWGLKWTDGMPETAHYICEHCLRPFGEEFKRQMNAGGQFVAENPAETEALGFWMNALVGMVPGARWASIVKEWYEVKDKPLKRKQFINTVLCEPYKESADWVATNILFGRAERYEAEVPDGVSFLVRAVDTQDDRLEGAVFGFGHERETWPIDYEYLEGDPGTPVPWRRLNEWRQRTYRHRSGRLLRPIVCFIDRLGHHTTDVDNWVRNQARADERTFGIMGSGDENAPILGKPTFHKHAKITTYRVGTWQAKFDILNRLTIELDQGETRKPGLIHVPEADWFTIELLEQLSKSERLTEEVRRGKLHRFWNVLGPNHYLDLAVYALAAHFTVGAKTVTTGMEALAAELSSPFTPSDGGAGAPRSGRRMISPGISVV